MPRDSRSSALEKALSVLEAVGDQSHAVGLPDLAARLARETVAHLRDWAGWANGICLNVNLPALPADRVLGRALASLAYCGALPNANSTTLTAGKLGLAKTGGYAITGDIYAASTTNAG